MVAKLLGDKKIKSVIIDPPYGVAVAESKEGFQTLAKNKAIVNDHLQSDAEYRKFTRDWIEAITPFLERKNSFYIFNSDKMVFALREGMIDAGLKFGQLLIWVKTHAVVGRMDYAPQHELIAYGWHGVHEFLKSKDKSVLVCPKPNKSKMHPTTKPLDLIRRLILNGTRIGDVVYDGFLGSGTTLLACEQTKRICIGVELDPEYCQTIIDRFEKLTGLKAERYE
jgi:site-specific DNA-methyltransferase (adenine-specific)